MHTEEQTEVRLVWNVYRHNFNSNKVEAVNIFDHWKFNEDVLKDLRRRIKKEEFADRLRRNLMYWFWSKCEHEIIVSSWPYTDKAASKIDIYQQVMMNWNVFVDYVWSFRKEVRNGRKKTTDRERRTPPPEEVQEERATTG